MSTTIEQRQTPLNITNMVLAPYLEKTSKELVEEVQNAVSENPLLNVKSSEQEVEPLQPANESQNDDSTDDYPTEGWYGGGKKGDPERTVFTPDAADEESLQEHLMNQINERELSEHDAIIAKYIVGNLDSNGWLVRSTSGIADDLTFNADLEVERDDVERVLAEVQQLDPPGIGGRTLRECLLIQVQQKPDTPENRQLQTLIDLYLKDLELKHFDRICSKMNISADRLQALRAALLKLNPKPGNAFSSSPNDGRRNQIIPEFEVTVEDGIIELSMPNSIPELALNEELSGEIETGVVKDKSMKDFYDRANRFISILKRRQEKLMQVMKSIIKHQKEFFLSGDEHRIVPMKYKDIELDTGLDQTSISRICGGDKGKYVSTPWGTYKLKDFFSTGIPAGENGEDSVSSKAVKSALKEIVAAEPKNRPYGDAKLEALLKARGYNVARRTVAKYRMQLGIPDSRRRKDL